MGLSTDWLDVNLSPVYIILHDRNYLGNTCQVMAKTVMTASLALALNFFTTIFLESPQRSSPEHDLNIQSLWDIKKNPKRALTPTSHMSNNLVSFPVPTALSPPLQYCQALRRAPPELPLNCHPSPSCSSTFRRQHASWQHHRHVQGDSQRVAAYPLNSTSTYFSSEGP